MSRLRELRRPVPHLSPVPQTNCSRSVCVDCVGRVIHNHELRMT